MAVLDDDANGMPRRVRVRASDDDRAAAANMISLFIVGLMIMGVYYCLAFRARVGCLVGVGVG